MPTITGVPIPEALHRLAALDWSEIPIDGLGADHIAQVLEYAARLQEARAPDGDQPVARPLSAEDILVHCEPPNHRVSRA